MKSYSISVDVIDPFADAAALEEEYGFGLAEKITGGYDAVVITVLHDVYKNFDLSILKAFSNHMVCWLI
jgi:UDP-N-acetyl-D-galactosamine dehydrogenase